MSEPALFCNEFSISKTIDAIVINFYFRDPSSDNSGQQFLLKKIADDIRTTVAELLNHR